MTANERFKRRARKLAAERGISVARAARILREQHAQQQDLTDSEQQALTVDLSTLDRGGDGKTEATIELAAMFRHGAAPRLIDGALPLGAEMEGQVKGHRGKTDAAALLAQAFGLESGRFDPFLIDTDSLGMRETPPWSEGRQRVAAFLISWLVTVSESEDPQQVTVWLGKHGRRLTLPEQLMLEMLLADPELRAKHPPSEQAGNDPEQYLDNVIGLICEELAEAWPAQVRDRRSFADLEQPEARLAHIDNPLPPLTADSLSVDPLYLPSLGAKGGQCAGLPACSARAGPGAEARSRSA